MIKKRIGNAPLKIKILAIVMIAVAVTAGVSFFALHIYDSAYQELLYQSLSDSLSYSSKDISDYLVEMEQLSMMLLSDEHIQDDLTKVQQQLSNSLESMNAIQRIRSNVGGYYQSYSDGILRYITLYTHESTVYTNILRADGTPKDVQNELIRLANEMDGAPAWCTDYMEEYGLFLVRNVNRISSPRLDRIGTILINVNMNALIKSATQFSGRYGDVAYAIMDDGQMLYQTNGEHDIEIKSMAKSQKHGYRVVNAGEHSYFIVCGKIPNYDWDYYCMVSYDDIARQIANARMMCVLVILLDLLLVILLSSGLVGSLTAHVRRLTDKMKQFALNNARVPTTKYDYSEREDELGMLHRQFDSMSGTIVDLIQENYISELLKKEAQIKALEHQINPHFLYNTLESIRMRAKAVGEANISDMVESLGTLLRSSLSNYDEMNHSIGKEMEIVTSYLTIQQIRYEERLIFESQISEAYYGFSIPKLTIQPLIENAVYYGLEANVDECTISLSADRELDVLRIFVKNTGSEMDDDLLERLGSGDVQPHGHGIELVNIDKRVKMQYGDEYGLRLYNEDDCAVAELVIPMGGEA